MEESIRQAASVSSSRHSSTERARFAIPRLPMATGSSRSSKRLLVVALQTRPQRRGLPVLLEQRKDGAGLGHRAKDGERSAHIVHVHKDGVAADRIVGTGREGRSIFDGSLDRGEVDPGRLGAAAGDAEHAARRIQQRHFVAAFGERNRDRPRATSGVEDPRGRRGEGFEKALEDQIPADPPAGRRVVGVEPFGPVVERRLHTRTL